MNADPTLQLRLLDLQALDTTLGQLAHRRAALPEHARHAELTAAAEALRRQAITWQAELSDLSTAQAKADQDVEQVRMRVVRDQERLDSGAVGNARDLENLQRELVSLARRQAELEDVELEVMERIEDIATKVAAVQAELRSLDAELAEVEATRNSALAEIDGEASSVATDRALTVEGIPPDLLGLYEKLRADHGGVGAAALHRGQCTGCQMQLTPVDLVRLKDAAPDLVTRCEECRRILVRAPHSGL